MRDPDRHAPYPAAVLQDQQIAHFIQLSVAPVFLLSGIGSMLGVMTSRLARVVDRARALESQVPKDDDEAATTRFRLAGLSRRAKLVSRAITLCTLTAVLICAVIATLFLSTFVGFDASLAVALLFVAGILCFLFGLLLLLREVLVATATLRIGLVQEPRRAG